MKAGDSKTVLRQQIRARLKAMPLENRHADSRTLCERLLAQPVWKRARIVLLFAPFGDEPDIWPLIASALKEGKQVTLPKLDPAGLSYHASPVKDLEQDLAPGKFGILEPRHTPAAMALNRLDFVLVPGVAFDLRGRRLGRGKGFYDQLLALVRGTTCGIAFEEQIVEEIPVEPHDVLLNCILTPTRWIEP
jgi:5-formyltetrahydrofolate cyclo-ligase